jgi:hypothetical protein
VQRVVAVLVGYDVAWAPGDKGCPLIPGHDRKLWTCGRGRRGLGGRVGGEPPERYDGGV